MSYGPKQTLLQGFEKFVVKNPDGCWGWTGCIPRATGYGEFRHSMKISRAHRASWILHKGEIPKGMQVLHTCDNRVCSNPEHLFLGTNIDNIKDMISKKRHPTLAKSGEDNHRNRLTSIQVKEIRQLLKTDIKQKDIASLFQVYPSTISAIKRNEIWKDLT